MTYHNLALILVWANLFAAIICTAKILYVKPQKTPETPMACWEIELVERMLNEIPAKKYEIKYKILLTLVFGYGINRLSAMLLTRCRWRMKCQTALSLTVSRTQNLLSMLLKLHIIFFAMKPSPLGANLSKAKNATSKSLSRSVRFLMKTSFSRPMALQLISSNFTTHARRMARPSRL